ncbi:MAG TPA: methyltransferase domain-containing protein [Candidatus Methylacidiphilales bacterium]|jgi:SAM-dependent methyltransferase|nr:methyltransferase domain-containing protein [Candidatus Methylacidiphilales bacterium]
MKTIIQHYDKEYYKGHYGAFLDDEKYVQSVARFYQYAIFNRLDLGPGDRILDFGSGPGHLTLALEADCYDPSLFIQGYLKEKKRTAYSHLTQIPRGVYRAVFSSHSLEHSFNPGDELKEIHALLEEKGILILVLPKETIPGRPTTSVDDNRHFYAWNFQLLTNLLSATGYRVINQRMFHAPYGLRTLAKRLSVDAAVVCSHRFGWFVHHFPSLLTIAEKI